MALTQEATSSAPIKARVMLVFSFDTKFFTHLIELREKGAFSASRGGGSGAEVDVTVMGAVEPAPDGAALAVWVHGSSWTLLVLSGMMLYPS